MKLAFVFPGQGSQFIGMGKKFADNFQSAKLIFDEIDETLKQNLSRIIFEGSLEELSLTENTQPALMAVSLAMIRSLEKDFGFDIEKHVSFVAGHSLGEYSALAASKSINISDTAKLLRVRGIAMQSASPFGSGAMAAIMADIDFCKELVAQSKEDEVCDIANYNAPEQIVISGNVNAINRAVELASSKQKRAIKLNVSAAFHSKLMLPASEIMRETLNYCEIKQPIVPLVSNVTANITLDPKEIRSGLVEQVSGMVRWYETINFLKLKGVNLIIEVGAGKVLSGLTKRITKDVNSISLQEPSDIDQVIKLLNI